MKWLGRKSLWIFGLIGSMVLGIIEVWLVVFILGSLVGSRASWYGPRPRW